MRKIIILLNNLIIIVILISLKFVNCFDDKIISDSNQNISGCSASNQRIVSNPTGELEFNLSGTNINRYQTSSFSFQETNEVKYLIFESTERQYLDLNYTGPDVEIKMYNYNYFNSNDYLSMINTSASYLDYFYMDMNKKYVFAIKNIDDSIGSFSVMPIDLTYNLEDHEKYVLHIDYDNNLSLKYRYNVQRLEIDLNSSTNAESYITYPTYGNIYLNKITTSNNFNINDDPRRLVSSPNEEGFNAIAYAEVMDYLTIPNVITQTVLESRGTGTFIDNTTVLSCSHIFYIETYDSNNLMTSTKIARNANFYPGANSYSNNSSDWYSNYGKYTATDTYLPISYILTFDSSMYNKWDYDWSISVTECSISGTYEHSYMGLYYIAGNTSNLVRSAGYPALVKSSNNELYEHSMWAMYPIENSIIGNGNTFKSTEIVISNGNSGGPLYGYHTGIEYGHQYKYAYLYGITVAFSTSEYENQLSKFNFSLSVRIRPVIINAYKELVL